MKAGAVLRTGMTIMPPRVTVKDRVQVDVKEVVFLGIDPGKSGGISSLHVTVGSVGSPNLQYAVMPNDDIDLYKLIKGYTSPDTTVVACLEQVSAAPVGGAKQGTKSMFTFGMGYGKLQMALTACDIPFKLVVPRVWQKYHKIQPRKQNQTKQSFKDGLLSVAKRLHPELELWSVPRSLGLQRSVCDAILIADYCYAEWATYVGIKS